MILNINDSTNYLNVSTNKVSLSILYYIYVQSQINLLIRNFVLSCPLPPLFIRRAVFQFVYKKQKKFSTFLQKIMAVTLTC